MKPWTLFAVLTFSLAPGLAEEPKGVPVEIKELIRNFYDACNAGDWAIADSLCLLPFYLDNGPWNDREKLKATVIDSFQGSNIRNITLEVFDVSKTKPTLTKKASDFLKDGDQLIGIQYDIGTPQGVQHPSGVLIVRRELNRLWITGITWQIKKATP